MVISCSAFNCTNRQIPAWKKSCDENQKEIHFHKFPLKNQALLKKWIHATKREKWEPTPYSFLCSDHFKPEDYKIILGKKKMLKEDSIPSKFKFPGHLIKKNVQRRVLLRIKHSVLQLLMLSNTS
ncbi:hypothetical protein WDU94_015518 [Cyamophila willieti]